MKISASNPMGHSNKTKRLSACRVLGIVVALVFVAVVSINGPFVMAASPQAGQEEVEAKAAWEFRPYKVEVWLAHNDSWRIQSVEQKLIEQLSNRASLADRSGWKVNIRRAPNPWNWRLISGMFDRSLYSGDLQADVLNAVGSANDADKLIVVKIDDQSGLFNTSVQEFDLKTMIWGAKVKRTASLASLDSVIYDSIETAFMPITRIENVHNLDVRCRVRGIGIARFAERDENGEWQMVDNNGSPAWVNDHEILMPVLIRKDRSGNLESIKAIDWTFLAIKDRAGPSLNCHTHSMRRAPLGQRTGGRTERLALCVRAPDRETTVKMISNDKAQIPLPDLEVYSRRPDQEKGTDNEFLGKTDWRGQIVVPPNEDPIRILLVKSGRRPLARAPVVPGLYDTQVTSMPNDEQRLFAEGITRGLFNELMDNVARRQLIAERVRIAMEKGRLEQAEGFLRELRDIPDTQEFNQRLNGEKQILMKDADKRQKDFINGYFVQLENAASKFLNTIAETELVKKVQDAK